MKELFAYALALQAKRGDAKPIVIDDSDCCYITKGELLRGAISNLFRGQIQSAWLCLKSARKARWS